MQQDVSGNSSNPGIPESSEYYNETIASSQYTGELLTGLTSPKGEKHVAEFKFEAGNSTGKGILCLVGINTKRFASVQLEVGLDVFCDAYFVRRKNPQDPSGRHICKQTLD